MWTSVRDGDTYVRRRRNEDGRWSTEAFDLARDPGGERDVFDGESRLHRELERELEAYQAHLVARYPAHESEQSLRKEEVEERLRALGYIRWGRLRHGLTLAVVASASRRRRATAHLR
jgi:hypothetical protein